MHPVIVVSVALFVVFVSASIYWSRSRAAQAEAVSANAVVRIATLDASSRCADTAWWMTTACALVPLLATGVLLATRWNDLPLHLPIHWGFDGHPNAWATRGPLIVFAPLVCGAIAVALLISIGVSSARYSPGFAGRSTVLGTARDTLRGAVWLISLILCAASALPLAKNPTVWVYCVIAASIVASLVLLTFVVSRSLRLPETVLSAARRTTEDRFWTAGLIYRNPDDMALWVPKRSGLGYTLNFGQPVAWIVPVGILVFTVVFPVLLHAMLR